MSLPFDEERYNSLMSRLEAVEVSIRNLEAEKFRIDSEYYKKHHISNQMILLKNGKQTIQSIGGILDCSAFYPSIANDYNFDGVGIPFVRVNEIQAGLIKISDSTAFLPQAIIDRCPTIAVANIGDIVIAKGGNTLAKVGLIGAEYPLYAMSRDVIIVRTTSIIDVNHYYLWAFLHSDIGQSLLWRSASQTGQPHLTLPSIYAIPIPSCSKSFQNKFEKLYTTSQDIAAKSVFLYTAAQNLLLAELGLSDYTPTNKSISVKTFADSFGTSGRLDAEYYQPKYEEVERKIKNYKNGFQKFNLSCNLHDDNFTPNDNLIYKYIELSNIGNNGEIVNVELCVGKELPTRARRKIKAGQVMVSSIEGSLESCAFVTEDYDDALCSTGFYVINSDIINSETLLMLFKSFPIQAILKQRCSGTILTAINKNELLSIPIPIIGIDVQNKISNIVKEMYATRKKSTELLDCAKQAVEMAIEQGEDVALKWLEEKVSNSFQS